MSPRHATCALLVSLLAGSTYAAHPSRGLAEAPPTAQPLDSDHDGLSDTLEQDLIHRFVPFFRVERDDCATRPAQFVPRDPAPTVAANDGTVYGQASPHAGARPAQPAEIELHFFHLWSTDCGRHGHPLDAEHVSALLQLTPGLSPKDPASWKAVLWYAAAHEDTVCDVSQITRAGTVDATDHGAAVWISPGKHASFLALALCGGGCGGDRCRASVALASPRLINLGEPGAPLNGIAWLGSAQWALAAKMSRSDFSPASRTRVEQLPATDIAWVRPGKHPALQTIAISGATEEALARSAGNTGDALGRSGHNTDVALILAGDSTGNALGKSYRETRNALGRSAHAVGRVLHPHTTPNPEAPK